MGKSRTRLGILFSETAALKNKSRSRHDNYMQTVGGSLGSGEVDFFQQTDDLAQLREKPCARQAVVLINDL